MDITSDDMYNVLLAKALKHLQREYKFVLQTEDIYGDDSDHADDQFSCYYAQVRCVAKIFGVSTSQLMKVNRDFEVMDD